MKILHEQWGRYNYRSAQIVTAKSMHVALSTNWLLPICCVGSFSPTNFILPVYELLQTLHN
jgi:hypothetical protein